VQIWKKGFAAQEKVFARIAETEVFQTVTKKLNEVL
jgi:hypothetical protein